MFRKTRLTKVEATFPLTPRTLVPKGLQSRRGTRPGNSSLARKIRVSGTKMAYLILENSIQVITFFRVDISEVNYATCRYIIDNIQTHFPF